MPASRSPRQSKLRTFAVPVAIGVIAVLAVLVSALPASLCRHLLPPSIHAADFSGSLWHGAAGSLLVNEHRAGAIEWRLHPGDLLHLRLGLDLTWAIGGFSLAGSGTMSSQGFAASPVNGGGPLEDLGDLAGLRGWHGSVAVALDEVTAGFDRLHSIRGEIRVSDLHAVSLGDDAGLGGYSLHFDDRATSADGAISGLITDDGGPLQVHGTLTLTPRDHTGTLHAMLIERPAATPALRKALEELAQLRPRDAQGRIPLEIEFAW